MDDDVSSVHYFHFFLKITLYIACCNWLLILYNDTHNTTTLATSQVVLIAIKHENEEDYNIFILF